jgi:lipopolysaccharide export system protein LptA
MKTAFYSIFIALAFLPNLSAQVAPGKTAGGAALKETEVASNSFRLDLGKKLGTFAGSVVVKDPNFDLTSDELVVYFDEANKMQRLVARGNVKIKQGSGRTAEAREAEYSVTDKKIKLTGDPVVNQGANRVTGTVISIYPDSDRMDVDGRSKVQFYLQ